MSIETTETMSKATPTLYGLAVEHLNSCRACTETAGSHHVGVGHPLEQVQIHQSVEYVNSLLEQTNKLIGEMTLMMQELQIIVNNALNPEEALSKWYKIGAAVGMVGTFLVGLVF